MADRSVSLKLSANVSGLTAGLKTAQNAVKKFDGDLTSWAKKNEAALDDLGNASMLMGAGMVAGVGLAVKGFADFDKQMSSVKAATHETEANMKSLRQAAIDAGADTAFSASEAAQGIEEMAKAGVSTKDILGGGLNGALALAAAGSIDVAEASETAASAMTQFKLSGEDIPHIADLLAAGAGKAQGSVSDMGAALNQSGLIASQTGLTIEETTGGLAAFASAGLVGSDAGTSFKTMLQALTPNSEKAATAMAEMGISAYDSQGNFVGLSEFAGQLKSSLSGLTAEQRNSTLETIFGSDAVRAAAVLYEQGAEGVQQWEDAVNDAGYAAETAAIMQDNLAGDIEKLGGSLDSVFLKSGSGANEVLRGLAQGAEGFIDAVGNIPEPVLNIGLILAGIAGGGALAAGGVMKVLPKIVETREAFDLLAPAGGKARGALVTAGKAAGIAAVGFAAVATAVDLAAKATDEARTKTTIEGFDNALTGIATKAPEARAALDGMFDGITKPGNADAGFTAVKDLESALNRVFNPTFNDKMNDFWSTVFFQNDTSGMNVTKDALADLDSSIAGIASSGNAEDAAAAFKEINRQAAGAGIPVSELVSLFPEYQKVIQETATNNGQTQLSYEDLVGAMSGAGPASLIAAEGLDAAAVAAGAAGTEAGAAAPITEEMAEALADIGITAEGAIVGLSAFTDYLFNSGLAVMSSRDAAFQWKDTLRDMGEGIDEVLNSQGELGAALNKNATDFNTTTDAGKAANEMFQGVVQEGLNVASTFAGDTSKSIKDVQGQLKSTYDAGVSAAQGLGLPKDAAIALTREVLQIPEGVSIDSWMSTEAKRAAEETTGAVNEIDGRKVSVNITDDGTAAGVLQNLQNVSAAVEGVPDRTIIIDEPLSPEVRAKLETLGYVVKTLPDGNIQVSQTGAAPTQAEIEGVANKPYNATVNANAQTGAAEAALNHTARDRSSTVTQTVLKTEHTRYTGETALDRLGAKKATGGAVFGPGTGTSDDIPAWLSNGEHVLTAAEVEKLGGHGAVYNLRAMAMRGDAPKFAAGGRVGWARNQQDREWREWDRLRKTKPRDTGKNDAQIRRHEDKIRKARDEYEAAKDRTQRLIEDERDLKTDLRRGTIREQFASGSGMSVVDQMFEESRNTDLSRNQRNNLARTASSTERQLLSLERRAESLAGKLETAKSKYDDLVSVRDSVAGGLRDEFSLQGAIDDQQRNTFKPVTARSLRDAAWGKADQMRAFALKLEALRKKGYNAAIIQEVAGMGMDAGTLAADALLSGANWERDSLNKAYGSMDYWSREAGINVTESMYKGGVNAAQGVVRGLESQTKTVETAFYNLGVAAEKAFKRSLDIRSPSRLLEKDGINAVLGIESGVEKRKPYLEAAMGNLMQPGSYGSWGAANINRPVASVMSSGGGDQHFHIDAKPGLAYEYAHTVAVETAVKVKDTMTAHSL